MNPQIVEVFTTTRTTTPHEHTEKYTLRRDRRMVWLQRVCLGVLRKLGCFAIYDEVLVTRHRIDTSSFMAKLYAQQAEILSMYHLHGERLLIGLDDYREMMNAPEINQLLSFDASYNYGRTVMGMKVTVVPWMKGVLVVPKEQ